MTVDTSPADHLTDLCRRLRASMPEAMRKRQQWLLWRFEVYDGDTKPRKVPYYVTEAGRRDRKRKGVQGNEADRAALATFEAAVERLALGGFSGLGFAFLPGDGLMGIDIDRAIDVDGVISQRAQKIIEACASYTELSPSGKGLHIIVLGEATFKDNGIGLEVFSGRQFFTCTGQLWPGAPTTVEPVSEAVVRRLRATVEQGRAERRGAARQRSGGGAPAVAASGDLTGWLEQALGVLDSGRASYDEWIGVGMALKSALGDAGEGLWDYWSSKGGERYCGRDKIATHWRSFKGDDADGALTIFKMARRGNVWRPPAEWFKVYDIAQQGEPPPRLSETPSPEDQALRKVPERAPPGVGPSATHHDLATEWVRSRAVDGHAPVYAAGSFYEPRPGGLWAPVSMEAAQVQVAALFNGTSCKTCRKQSDYRQIVAHGAALVESPDFFEAAPIGITTPAGFHRLAESGCIKTEGLRYEHRQTFALAHAPDYEAEAPLMDGLLAAAFEGDSPAEQVDLWWQCFGAALFGLLPRLQIAVLLLGVQGSGKSTNQRILESAFPRDAVCAVSPQQWGHEYHVAALAGKRLNVVGELADDAPIPAAPFKNVTGLNLVGARNPTHRPFSFRNAAAHVFASNVLPPTTDRSEAFYRRWRVLRFSNTVPPERVDHRLLDKIVVDEMPAILASAFLGAERASRAGGLRTTPAHSAVMEKWRHAANPLQQFLGDDEWIVVDPAADLHTPREVYEAYRRWSAAAGFRNPFGRNHFLDLLDSTGASRGVRVKRVGTKNAVVGIRLVRTE